MTASSGNTPNYGQADFAATTANPAHATDAESGAAPHEDRVSLSAQALALSQSAAQADDKAARAQQTQAVEPHQLQFPDAALMAKLRAQGIPTQPAFMLDVDPATHRVSVLGARPDASRIAAMINTSA
ncbi:hypothetical protein DFP86_11714 [Paludibacterium purpuratum]|uniref:Uncharacterized protein n=2 Tax=Paludibacterium purpuratum TaxID=1144873 RepID=A0A4R7AZD4_9NEIS|nr:hypothetical protein DFP86_11714 [Paludibacterium purpuratum]